MKNISVFFCICFLSMTAHAQLFQPMQVPVFVDDTPILSPWTGGINAPQWSAADLNEDGKPDLYAFDRDGHIHLTFINEGNPGEIKYRFAPEYARNFPPLKDFTLLRDYNGDNIQDLFAYAHPIPGMRAFTGYYEDNKLKFTTYKTNFPDTVSHALTVPLNNGTPSNLSVSRPDYPAVGDMDGDGDLDILSLYFLTGNTLVYYQNMALEYGFTKDTLIYEKKDACWMKLFIPTLTTSLVLSCDPDSCANTCPAFGEEISEDRNGGVHGASTLLTHDFDGDGDVELLYGDLQYPNVIFLENDETSGKPWAITQDTFFPEYDTPVDLNNFPASFKIDIDNDGILEFMFSPNTFGSIIRDVENVFLYENTGTNEVPVLSKQNENIIAKDMIDVGSVSQPAFFDYNADGLMDFVVGNFYQVAKPSNVVSSSIALFENTGTLEEPAFTLIDENYLDFAQFNTVSEGFAPTFGDLDNDGDTDMLVGDKDGKLFYVQNNGGPGNPVDFAAPQFNWQSIDVGQNAAPHIYDANGDDLPDLLIGHKLGTVRYFQNNGTPGTPSFDPDVDNAPNNIFLGGINTQDQSTTAQGLSAPVVLELGDTTFIVTGGESGFLEVYVFDSEKLGQGEEFEKVSEKFANFYQGTFSRISFANLDDDDTIEVLTGNHRGGLSLYKSPFTLDGLTFDAVGEQKKVLDFDVFPNPTDGLLNIQLFTKSISEADYRLFSTLGQTVLNGRFTGNQNSISMNGLNPGIYFLEIKQGAFSGIKKVFLK